MNSIQLVLFCVGGSNVTYFPPDFFSVMAYLTVVYKGNMVF